MRLFLYYAFHTTVNTLKKLLKTWVAIIIVSGVAAGIIGMLIGRIVPLVINAVNPEQSITETVSEKIGETEESEEEKEPSAFRVFLEKNNLNKYDVTDLVVTAAFLLMVTLVLTGANKGGQIFKPADVPILFASPMKPQSVLLFRMMLSLGMNIFVSLYMLGQIPNLVQNLHFSVWGAFSLLVAYSLTLVFSSILQIGFYVLACRTKKGSLNIAAYILGFYVILSIAYFAYAKITGQGYALAAFRFFGNRKTFWIPFIGWLRGMIYYALTGENFKSVMFFLLFVAVGILLIVLIWNMKADFYENAMFATEKIAAQMENQKNAAKGAATTREKDRSKSLERDGFHYGSGASVFFYKSVYNRFRFAKFRFVTVKFLIYLFAAGISGFFAGKIANKEIAFLIPAVIILLIAYYAAMGNPLEEDTSREFFILIPESPLKKVWASLLGCITVNAIDIIIPLTLAAVFVKANPVTVLIWFFFILSAVMFAATAGTFINLSVPGDHAQTFKMMLQMMIVYFGTVPSLGLILFGLLIKNLTVTMLPGIVIHVAISSLFAFLSTKFLGNR